MINSDGSLFRVVQLTNSFTAYDPLTGNHFFNKTVLLSVILKLLIIVKAKQIFTNLKRQQ